MSEAAERVPSPRVGFGNPPIHTRFGQPGGNVPGRAGLGPVASLMAKVRAHYQDGDKLLPILDEALSSKKASDRLTAVQIILERGWGKAPQPIAVAGNGEGGLTLNANGLNDVEFKQLGELLSKLVAKDDNDRSSSDDHR